MSVKERQINKRTEYKTFFFWGANYRRAFQRKYFTKHSHFFFCTIMKCHKTQREKRLKRWGVTHKTEQNTTIHFQFSKPKCICSFKTQTEQTTKQNRKHFTKVTWWPSREQSVSGNIKKVHRFKKIAFATCPVFALVLQNMPFSQKCCCVLLSFCFVWLFLSIIFHLSKSHWTGNGPKTQVSLSEWHFPAPEVFPAQKGYLIPQACSGPCLCVSNR